jgi:hypothetical protein
VKKCNTEFIVTHTLRFKVVNIATLIYLPQNVSVKTNAKRNDNAIVSNLRGASRRGCSCRFKNANRYLFRVLGVKMADMQLLQEIKSMAKEIRNDNADSGNAYLMGYMWATLTTKQQKEIAKSFRDELAKDKEK